MTGYRDILALLLGWLSARGTGQTDGPHRAVAGEVFVSTAMAGGVFHSGAAAAIASAGNVTTGACNG
jgi:hypothetical protein